MGDPSEFRIKQGANPHTRNRWGFKKQVDLVKAEEQWAAMYETLRDHGVQVHIIPAHCDYPGLVFPANAGSVIDSEQRIALDQRTFVASRLNPARVGEAKIYRDFIDKLGLSVEEIHLPFEGEADLIPWGGQYLFTYGPLRRQKYVPTWGLPPWKRVYGFRSDQRVIQELGRWVPLERVIKLELVDERYYHGDTVLCSFGPKRQYLLAYEAGLITGARELLGSSENIIWLNREDAEAFAANSFGVERDGQAILFIPAGISAALRQQIEAMGTEVVLIDVSEFLEKGGGSVKCMIGDLGNSP